MPAGLKVDQGQMIGFLEPAYSQGKFLSGADFQIPERDQLLDRLVGLPFDGDRPGRIPAAIAGHSFPGCDPLQGRGRLTERFHKNAPGHVGAGGQTEQIQDCRHYIQYPCAMNQFIGPDRWSDHANQTHRAISLRVLPGLP